ncbi:MAG: hypothetical protein ACE5E1_09315 [Phycisphaerae bacterium]
MFGLPGIGGGLGGGFFPLFGIFFIINLVIKLFSGDLASIFGGTTPM